MQFLSDTFLKTVDSVQIICNKIRLEEIATRNPVKEYSLLRKITTTPEHAEKLVLKYKSKNRYQDVLPYEFNLVRLSEEPLSEQNYINASYIENFITNGQRIIMTQGPLPHTAADFWTMVERNKTKLIVAIVEKSSLGSKCEKYWPNDQMQLDKYLIQCIEEEKNEFFETRKLLLTNKEEEVTHEVTHIYIYGWQDKSTPKDHVRRLVELLGLFSEKYHIFKNSLPIIHCSAGIGRSGVFMSSFLLFEQFKKCKESGGPFEFSIFDTVRKVRD